MKIKVGGTWKDAVPSVKVGGVWKDVQDAHVKVNGVWKQVYKKKNPLFVTAAVSGTTAAYSTNGTSWTGTTLPVSATWLMHGSHQKGAPNLVLVPYGGQTGCYTANGTSWSTMTMPSSGNWYSVAYGNNVYVATIFQSTSAAYSTNGINWTAVTLPNAATKVNFSNGYFVVASQSGNFSVSTNGTSWSSVSAGGSSGWRVAVGNESGSWCAAIFNNRSFSSNNASSWSSGTHSAQNTDIANGAFGFSRWIFPRGDLTSSNTYITTTDGTNFSNATFTASGIQIPIVFGNNLFVASIAGTSTSNYSTNGTSWTASTLPSSQAWRTLVYRE